MVCEMYLNKSVKKKRARKRNIFMTLECATSKLRADPNQVAAKRACVFYRHNMLSEK